MKTASVIKSAGGLAATQAQLAKINAYSRRELAADEVYVFSLVLCDNEVDRDFERFPKESLERLAELFVGKTGIFDHNPKGENQTSRIFDTRVEAEPEKQTAAGEEYCALRAWAYMVRCGKNADLILEIDAGIKKEVSVGCAVSRAECSVCGADTRAKPCAHEPGKSYHGALCWRDLTGPTDAYEWSFVAVPAQKQAGVTKGLSLLEETPEAGLDKAFLGDGPVTLSKAQASALAARVRELDALAADGRLRLEGLRRDFVRLAAFALPGVDAATVEEVAGGMDGRQLAVFCKGLTGRAPGASQLGGSAFEAPGALGMFRI